MAHIDVFAASAGSGKTYTLARRVIDLLISEPSNALSAKGPEHYSHILAVTFTNKATAEMKSRIVEDLATIADDNDTSDSRKNLIQAQIKTRQEIDGTTVSENAVVADCKKALDLILSDFEHLSVSTIDSFVQRIVRSFAYDKGLPANYAIQIDEDALLDKAIDSIMANIATEDNRQLLNWLIAYANELVEEGAKWDIEKGIRALGKNAFNKNELDTDNLTIANFVNVKNKLRKTQKELKESIKNALLQLAGMPEAAKIKNNSTLGHLLKNLKENKKLKPGEPMEKLLKIFLEGKDQLSKGTDQNTRDAIESSLGNIARLTRRLRTCDAINKNIYSLGVLSELQKAISETQKQEHYVAIQSTNDLLNSLLHPKDKSNEVPFIYEKAGIRFDNIMIDEFQDTSVVQYRNFMPLLENSLSEGHDCLVVGDVKQSIYRFREGDWRILHNLSNGSQGDHTGQEFAGLTALHTLGDNWRSLKSIVEFNNLLYSDTSELQSNLPKTMDNRVRSNATATKIYDIYRNSHQNVKRKGTYDGFVSVQIIMSPNGRSEQEKAARLAASHYVEESYIQHVKELVSEKNYRYSDICFLTNTKIEGETIINNLNLANIPSMSSDSLFVAKATSVKCVLDMLTYMTKGDLPALFRAATVLNNNDIKKTAANWSEERTALDDKLQRLRGLGTVELLNALMDLIPTSIRSQDLPFIEAFYERVLQFVNQNSSNIGLFLDFAEQDMKSWVIEAPADMDAVNVMTIHKSKGLQFKVVMIPFFEWDSANNMSRAEDIWCDATKDEVVELTDCKGIKELPIKFSTMEFTAFEDEMKKEDTLRLIDSLNKAYVATTRAEDMLFIWGINKVTAKESANKTISQFLLDSLGERLTEETVAIQQEDGEEEGVSLQIRALQVGTVECNQQTKQTVSSKQPEADYDAIFSTLRPSDNLAIAETEETGEADKRHGMVAYGIAMHNIFQRIVCEADTNKALNWALGNGIVNAEQKERLEKLIPSKMASVRDRHWFDGSMQNVWCELTMVGDASVGRADRIMRTREGDYVVVDYKFGDKTSKEYNEQVRQYMRSLRASGAKNVRGYIWYFEHDKVEEVA